MRANPLTYGVEALRAVLFPAMASPLFPLGSSITILAVFSAAVFAVAFLLANRRSTKPAA
jgi:ABC-type polysaccharide/polyol phosphate export permease